MYVALPVECSNRANVAFGTFVWYWSSGEFEISQIDLTEFQISIHLNKIPKCTNIIYTSHHYFRNVANLTVRVILQNTILAT